MRQRVRISSGGQISIPAAIRRRWGTRTLILRDDGDRLVLEPTADDPIAAAEGALAAYAPETRLAELRGLARQAEAAATQRRPST